MKNKGYSSLNQILIDHQNPMLTFPHTQSPCLQKSLLNIKAA